MRHTILAAAMFSALAFFPVGSRAEGMDDKPDSSASTMTGVLIDNHCGADKKEADAAKHPLACASKEACAASGYELVVGDKHYKFDDKGNDAAKAYLKTAKSSHVVVEGKAEGDKMEVTSIKAAPMEDKKDTEKKEK